MTDFSIETKYYWEYAEVNVRLNWKNNWRTKIFVGINEVQQLIDNIILKLNKRKEVIEKS